MENKPIVVFLALAIMAISLRNDLWAQVSTTDPTSKWYLAGERNSVMATREGTLQSTPPKGYDIDLRFDPCGEKDTLEDSDASIPADQVSFNHALEGDIPGGLYEVVLNLATAKEERGKNAFEVVIVLDKKDTNIEIGRTVVTGASTTQRQFTLRMIGIDPETEKGDRLKLVIKNLSSYRGTLRYGGGEGYLSYVKVPW